MMTTTTANRMWGTFLAFLVIIGMMAIVPMTSASAEPTPPSKYYAKDDVISHPMYYFPSPFDGSGKYVKAGWFDKYNDKGFYSLNVLLNDSIGYSSPASLNKAYGVNAIDVPKVTSGGKTGYIVSNYRMRSSGYSVLYTPTKPGTDHFEYSVEARDGSTVSAAVTVQNIAVQNVKVQAMYKGAVFTNPNPFKVKVRLYSPDLVNDEPNQNDRLDFTLQANTSRAYKMTSYLWYGEAERKSRKIYHQTTVPWAHQSGTYDSLKGAVFLTRSLKADKKYAAVSTSSQQAKVRLTNTTRTTATYKLIYKKKGSKKYTTTKHAVKAGKTRVLKVRVQAGSTFKVKSGGKTITSKKVPR